MSTIKIARRVTMRVARNLFSDHFNDPAHSSMYHEGKTLWADEQARLQAEREIEDEYHAAIREHHKGLDELSRPADDEVMPQGNVNVAEGVEWVTVPRSYLDASGKPVALRAPRMKDNRPEHDYMDNWMSHGTVLLRRTTKEGTVELKLRYGYTNDDINPRVLGYAGRGFQAKTSTTVPEGFPSVGASWEDVLAWPGVDEDGCKRAIYVAQRCVSHFPDWDFMTEEQRNIITSYDPWRTELSRFDKLALKPSCTKTEHYEHHLKEMFKDDHWH